MAIANYCFLLKIKQGDQRSHVAMINSFLMHAFLFFKQAGKTEHSIMSSSATDTVNTSDVKPIINDFDVDTQGGTRNQTITETRILS